MSSTINMSPSVTTPQQIPRLTRNGEALTSAERWQAITARDPTINSFVYAVLTTKIYCRPSCPARLARRANVRFYDTPSQAEQAGFRPCKRCKPHSAQTAVECNPQAVMVERACEDIRSRLAAGMKPRLGELAARAGLTASHFHRVFKKRVGVTPGQYAADVIQGGGRSSSGSLASDDTLFEVETPSLDLGTGGVGQSLALWEGGLSDPVIMDEMWNEFDILLAAEQREISPLESVSIDPRLISVE